MRPVGRRLKNVGVQLPILVSAVTFLSAFIIGIVFLSVAWRLLPRERSSDSSQGPFEIADYTTEALLPAGSPLVGKTVGDLEALGEDDVAHRPRAAAPLRARRSLDPLRKRPAGSGGRCRHAQELQFMVEKQTETEPAPPNVSSAIE